MEKGAGWAGPPFPLWDFFFGEINDVRCAIRHRVFLYYSNHYSKKTTGIR